MCLERPRSRSPGDVGALRTPANPWGSAGFPSVGSGSEAVAVTGARASDSVVGADSAIFILDCEYNLYAAFGAGVAADAALATTGADAGGAAGAGTVKRSERRIASCEARPSASNATSLTGVDKSAAARLTSGGRSFSPRAATLRPADLSQNVPSEAVLMLSFEASLSDQNWVRPTIGFSLD